MKLVNLTGAPLEITLAPGGAVLILEPAGPAPTLPDQPSGVVTRVDDVPVFAEEGGPEIRDLPPPNSTDLLVVSEAVARSPGGRRRSDLVFARLEHDGTIRRLVLGMTRRDMIRAETDHRQQTLADALERGSWKDLMRLTKE